MSTGTVKKICRICLGLVEEDQCPKCKPLWYTCTEHPEYFWTDKKVCPRCGPDPKAVFVEAIDVGEQFWETIAEEVEEKIKQIPAPPTPPEDEEEETPAEETPAEETTAEETSTEETSAEPPPEEKPSAREGIKVTEAELELPLEEQKPETEPKAGVAPKPGELVLEGPTSGSIHINVETKVGKDIVSQFGDESRFWSEPQLKLSKVPTGWAVLHLEKKDGHETLLNGKAVKGSQPLKDGDQLAVGSESRGISKLPLKVRIGKQANE